MSKVIERLYLSGFKEASNLHWLKQNGVTHIVNAAVELPNSYPKEFRYLRLDLDDTTTQTIYHVLNPSFSFIKNAITKGGTVLVHCAAGISRSATVVLYFLMMIQESNSTKYGLKDIYNFLKSKRGIIDPNIGFMNQLISVSPEIRRREEYLKKQNQRK